MDSYNNYYNHWKDLNFLVTFLATLGLVLAIYDYEICFNSKSSVFSKNINANITWVVILITFLNILAVFMKELTAQEWYDFRDPIIFYKT